LSYTTFAISEPRVERKAIPLGEAVHLAVDVKNTGERVGDEVVQLYIHQRAGRALRPIRELKGFQRITLAPNESKTVNFELPADALRYWSTADGAWVQDASVFDAWIGADSSTQNHIEFEVLKRSR
jgi:beta-glucosidase